MSKLFAKLDWIRLETELETERRADEIRRENRQNTHTVERIVYRKIVGSFCRAID